MTLEIVLLCLAGTGFFSMFSGLIWTNVAVQQMRKVLNERRSPKDQLRWHDAIQWVAQKVIDEYRKTDPDGPLYRKLKVGYYVAGTGGLLMIGSVFALKLI